MQKEKIYWEEIGVCAEVSSFVPAGGVGEFHVILHVEARGELFEQQLRRIYAGEERLLNTALLRDAHPVFKRYFLNDATNQVPLMKQEDTCALSFIQQPLLDGSKLAVWIYLQRGTTVSKEDDMLVARHNGYTHLWKMGMHEQEGDSARQTERLLQGYEDSLSRYGATLAENCIRTWFFVRDVDTHYAGLVKARKENFIREGLTEKTHYIASTGIGGAPADTKSLVQLGTYALMGFDRRQQHYLYAPTHLNPTYEYGVTFERGTRLDFGDRSHAIISGTASIDNRGQVVHVGDVRKQTERMWENVEALLKEADTTYEDVMQIVVYLRDVADYGIVQTLFKQRFDDIPTVITLAPVCRPQWLVEMECWAVAGRSNPPYRDF